MKKDEKKKLHGKGLEELKSILSKLKEELVNIKVGKAAKKQKDMHAFSKKRRKIAIVKTIIGEKILKGRQTS